MCYMYMKSLASQNAAFSIIAPFMLIMHGLLVALSWPQERIDNGVYVFMNCVLIALVLLVGSGR